MGHPQRLLLLTVPDQAGLGSSSQPHMVVPEPHLCSMMLLARSSSSSSPRLSRAFCSSPEPSEGRAMLLCFCSCWAGGPCWDRLSRASLRLEAMSASAWSASSLRSCVSASSLLASRSSACLSWAMMVLLSACWASSSLWVAF